MRRHRAYLLLFALLAFPASAPPAATAGGDEGYLRELQAAARERKLSGDRYWDILLHYRPHRGGRRSYVNDPRFFLAPGGATDPESELEATLAAFFGEPDGGKDGAGTLPPASREPAPPGGGADNSAEARQPARCRFPARFAWLSERLSIDPLRLPETRCADLDNALAQIAPRSAALVFASAYLNAPASMAGHTFLRVDSAYDSSLLSWAVNYAARTDPRDPGPVWAFKGIAGLYPGYFSILPYYEKLKEYGNMEQRDLWEYRLALTEGEVRRMVLHLWELQGIASDYYFLDRNCSYNLLFLLEAARPSAVLTDPKGAWVLPVETVERVLRAGLIGDASFRPSQVRKIRHAAGLLDAEKLQRTFRIDAGAEPPDALLSAGMPAADQARILDIASEHLQLRYAKNRLTQAEYRKRFMGILSARSRVPETEPDPAPPVPPRPESGHPASRATAAAGLRGGDAFAEVGWRPAYHALTDPGDGFAEGSQIVFSDVALRHYPAEGRLRLARWDLVDIFSAAPRDGFFRPVSWKFRTGLFAREFAGRGEGTAYLANAGAGVGMPLGRSGVAWAMAEAEGNVSSRYDRGFAVGAGGSAGALVRATDRWTLHAGVRLLAGAAGDTRRAREASAFLRQGYALSRTLSVSLDAGRTVSPGLRRNEAALSLHHYFR